MGQKNNQFVVQEGGTVSRTTPNQKNPRGCSRVKARITWVNRGDDNPKKKNVEKTGTARGVRTKHLEEKEMVRLKGQGQKGGKVFLKVRVPSATGGGKQQGGKYHRKKTNGFKIT